MAEYTFYPKFQEFITLYRGVIRVWIGNGIDTGEAGMLFAEYVDGAIQQLGMVSDYEEAKKYFSDLGIDLSYSDWVALLAETPANARTAQQSAESAEMSNQQSEAWAVGQKNGVDVSSTDPTYHNNAKYYSGNAGTQATNSANSAAAALASEQAAQTAQLAAEAAQSASELAQSAAETAQGLAEAAQTAAETAQSLSETAEAGSVSAKNAAITAKTASENAQAASETAQAGAETAQTLAEAAQVAAETAQGLSETAQHAAETAQTAAETAQSDAESKARDAEAWANGKRNNVDVSSTDPAYQNNSKYYMSVAAQHSVRSGTAETNAANSASAASAAQTAAETAQTAAETAQNLAETAQTAAETAQTAAETAQSASVAARDRAESAESDAVAAKIAAESARDSARSAIANMTVSAIGLPSGIVNPTATISDVDNHKHITFGLIKGDTGNTGATPNLAIGAVSTGNPGTDASASITGTAENPILNLTIPRGMPNNIDDSAGSGDIDKAWSADKITSELFAKTTIIRKKVGPTGQGAYTALSDNVPQEQVKEIKCEISPTQNCNGYSKPWKGGNGKNKIGSNIWYQNQYVGESGEILNHNPTYYRVGTTNFYGGFQSGTTYCLSGKNLGVESGSGIPTAFKPILAFWTRPPMQSSNFVSRIVVNQTTDVEYPFVVPEGTTVVTLSYVTSNNPSEIMIEEGSSKTRYEPYENVSPISGANYLYIYKQRTSGQVTLMSISLPSEARPVYGGHLTIQQDGTATLVVTMGYASNYQPGVSVGSGKWVSAIASYEEGKSIPYNYAAAYPLAEPVTYTFNVEELFAMPDREYLNNTKTALFTSQGFIYGTEISKPIREFTSGIEYIRYRANLVEYIEQEISDPQN